MDSVQPILNKFIYKYIYMKVIISVILYIIFTVSILCIISPLIDNIFNKLDKNMSVTRLFIEIVSQIIIAGFIWYIIDKNILLVIKKKLNIHTSKLIYNMRDIFISVVFVGLQTNLIDKLKYLNQLNPTSDLDNDGIINVFDEDNIYDEDNNYLT